MTHSDQVNFINTYLTVRKKQLENLRSDGNFQESESAYFYAQGQIDVMEEVLCILKNT